MFVKDTGTQEQNEIELARAVLAESPLPEQIMNVEIRTGEDSTGDPAMWISFQIKHDVTLDRDQIKVITRFISDAQARLIERGISRFPYAFLDEAA